MTQAITDILDNLKIDYKIYCHKPTFRCDEARDVDIPWMRVKSLLLRNKKKTRFFMIVTTDEKKLDMNHLRKSLGESKLWFASPELMHELIALEPGHVSPYALINNEEKNIEVFFDTDIKGQPVGFHPLQNTQTIVTNLDNVERFLDFLGFEYAYLEI